MSLLSGENNLPVFDFVMGVSLGVSFGALLTAVFYSTGLLGRIRKAKCNVKQMKFIAGIAAAVCVILLVLSIACFF